MTNPISMRATSTGFSWNAPDWRTVPVVTGRDEASGELQTSPLRCALANADAGRVGMWVLLAGLQDVAAGRRSWFGVRPRGHSQWYALRPEWQSILSRTPVGLLHAPAWAEDPAQREEACAAADIYFAVQPAHSRALTVLRGLMPSRRTARH